MTPCPSFACVEFLPARQAILSDFTRFYPLRRLFSDRPNAHNHPLLAAFGLWTLGLGLVFSGLAPDASHLPIQLSKNLPVPP
jgi:hypothetical protein